MAIFPKIQSSNSICISISIKSCNMGLKYVFNSYLDLLFTLGACPVCAPKKHSQRLKIGEFSKNFRVFQARGAVWVHILGRATHPEGVLSESITYLNIIGQLLNLNFVCWLKIGYPKGTHIFNESHILSFGYCQEVFVLFSFGHHNPPTPPPG